MKVKILFYALILMYVNGYAQFSDIALPSPDAAPVTTYGAIPVSMYTGTTNVTVPICTLEGRNYSLPVSITYNGSGNKVEDIASWVGLGWHLNAGGVITRIVRGLPDEDIKGFLGPLGAGLMPKKYFDYLNFGSVNFNGVSIEALGLGNGNDPAMIFKLYLKETAAGHIDTEPDIFYFSYPGGNGKFVFSEDGNPMVIPNSDIEILPGIGPEEEAYWTILTANGNKYRYGITDNAKEWTSSRFMGPAIDRTKNMITSWYLSEIVTPESDKVQFEYSDNNSIVYSSKTYYQLYYLNSDRAIYGSKYYDVPFDPETITSESGVNNFEVNIIINENTIQNVKNIKKITSSMGVIDFIQDTDLRLDSPGSRALQEIELKNHEGALIKKIILKHYYFNSGCDKSTCKRLSLSSLQEVSLTEKISPYRFEYNTALNLPERGSSAQDHWGYYNSNTSSNLIPSGIFEGVFYDGANRSPDTSRMQANILTKMIYPTGGYIEFQYESNTYFDQNNQEKVSGGLRVKQIKMKESAVSSDSQVKRYIYKKGRTLEWFEYYSRKNYGVVVYDLLGIGDHKHKMLYRSSVSSVEQASSQGASVGYEQVEEILPGRGKIIYRFTNPDTDPDFVINSNNLVEYSLGPDNVKSYKEPHINMDYLRGLPLQTLTFDVNGVIKKEIHYTYSYRLSTNGNLNEFICARIVQNDPVTIVNPYTGPNSNDATVFDYKQYFKYFYKYNTKAILLSTLSEVVHESGNVMNNTTTFEYSEYHLSPVKTITKQSDHRKLVTVMNYASDYSNTQIGANFYNNYATELDQNHNFKLIEKITYVETPAGKQVLYNNAGREIINGTLYQYNSNGTPSFLYSLEMEDPIPSTMFKFSNRGSLDVVPPEGEIAPVVKDAKYKRKIRYESYDENSNMMQFRKEDHVPTSIIWGYDFNYTPANTETTVNSGYNYPVGIVTNARRKQIAYTSFENDTDGDWNYYNDFNTRSAVHVETNKPTRSYFSGTITKKNLPISNDPVNSSKKYILSFYSMGVGTINIEPYGIVAINSPEKWTLFRIYFSNAAMVRLQVISQNQQTSLYIDDLTLHLNGTNIAFENFEQDNTGSYGWGYNLEEVKSVVVYAKTGRKYFSGTLVLKSPLEDAKHPSGEQSKYRVSFWAMGKGEIRLQLGNGTVKTIISTSEEEWKYYEVFLSNSEVKNISIITKVENIFTANRSEVYIDEVRLHPENSLMTTSTYKPLVGKTSETNPQNITTYYEFDSLGRLKLIRDQDRNILKRYIYNYKW